MTTLMSDPEVAVIPSRENDEPLVALDPSFGPARALVRRGIATRLAAAQRALPAGTFLRILEGHRTLRAQQAIVDSYSARVRLAHPGADEDEVHRLTSRFVAPVAVAPHVAGAAVDLTLVDGGGAELDLGTPVDATPEDSDGACCTDAVVPAPARRNRDLLCAALAGAGLVNYPTEWWHWSYGDRYWALVVGAPHAVHGPLDGGVS